ncbi:hypothetical protein Vadar_020239 [Vaccinium darrowii]|uniref:Uncharacterized protein n=1 Tax=Vaccinium darrowii TaxID=229202 RepID=A0ACB7XTF0_9ERIC|nr:hypothetical protein Vadar_020239 [Vaccinium darrowii]
MVKQVVVKDSLGSPAQVSSCMPGVGQHSRKLEKIGGLSRKLIPTRLKCLSFENGRILISNTCHPKISQQIHLEVNNQVYPINVTKEEFPRSPWPCSIHSPKVRDDDMETNKLILANHLPTAVDFSNLNQENNTMMDNFFIMHGECNLQNKTNSPSPNPKTANEVLQIHHIPAHPISTPSPVAYLGLSDPALNPAISNPVGPSLGSAFVLSPGPFLKPALQEVDSNLSQSYLSPRVNDKFQINGNICSQLPTNPSHVNGISLFVDLVPKKRKNSLEKEKDSQNVMISSPISTFNRFQILQRSKKPSIHKETEATLNTGKMLGANMKIQSWNTRGLRSRVKKRFLIKIIKDRRPDIMFIQESKLEQVELSDYQRFWGNFGVAGVFSKSEGA